MLQPADPLADLAQLEAALRSTSLPQLRASWVKAFGNDVPRLSRDMLVRAILWQVQINQHGRVSEATAQKLAAFVAGAAAERSAARTPAQPIKRYIRVWQGVTHTVEEVADGFLWRGNKHRSLSAVAKAITGTHWNGPLFFGLRDRSAWATGRSKRASPPPAAKPQLLKAAVRG